MTAILLDTNALLWLLTSPSRIAEPVRQQLADQDNEILVSAASAWEIAIKTRIGRLDGDPILAAWEETLTAIAATDLPIQSADAALAGRLDWDHRDPFDRMIVAQAVRRGLAIATSDKKVVSGALTTVLDTRG